MKIKSIVIAIGLALASVASISTWFSPLAIYLITRSILPIPLIVVIASIISSSITILLYLYKTSICTKITTIMIILIVAIYACTYIFNSEYLWFSMLSLVLALSLYIGRLYNTIITFSVKISEVLRKRILNTIVKRSWIPSLFLSIAIVAICRWIDLYVSLALIIIFLSLSIPLSILLKPFSKVDIEKSIEKKHSFNIPYITLSIYTIMYVLSTSMIYPYTPVILLEIFKRDLIEIGIFYGSIVVISSIVMRLAQLIILSKGASAAMSIRSIVSSLAFLTVASTIHPVVAEISLFIAFATAPLHTLSYSFFARYMDIEKGRRLELLYTATSAIAVVVGYILWLKNPRLILLIGAFIALASLVLLPRLRRSERFLIEQEVFLS